MAGTLNVLTDKRVSRGVVKNKVTFLADGTLQSGTTTAVASTDVFTTSVAHGLASTDAVLIVSQTGSTLPTVGTVYYVIAGGLTANDFKLSAAVGGASIDVDATITAMTFRSLTAAGANTGVVTAVILGMGVGKLVAVALKDAASGGDFGDEIITISDADSGAALLAIDTDAYKFVSTTTGEADDDLWTTGVNHLLVAGDRVRFITTPAGGTSTPTIAVDIDYFVLAAGLTATKFALGLTAGGAAIAIDTDYTSAAWVKRGSSRYFRPSTVVTTNAGAAVAAAAEAPNVNRDIYVAGPLKVAVEQAGVLGSGTLWLVVDESQRPRS